MYDDGVKKWLKKLWDKIKGKSDEATEGAVSGASEAIVGDLLDEEQDKPTGDPGGTGTNEGQYDQLDLTDPDNEVGTRTYYEPGTNGGYREDTLYVENGDTTHWDIDGDGSIDVVTQTSVSGGATFYDTNLDGQFDSVGLFGGF